MNTAAYIKLLPMNSEMFFCNNYEQCEVRGVKVKKIVPSLMRLKGKEV